MQLKVSQRLARSGVDEQIKIESYKEVRWLKDVPDWFWANRNKLFFPISCEKPQAPSINFHGGLPMPSDNLIFVNGKSDYSLMIWGKESLLYLDEDTSLPQSHIALGDGCIYVGRHVRTNSRTSLNCRNGGKIVLKEDILISSDVEILTDDCHTVLDLKTGARLNPFGGSVEIGRHVWINQKALIMGNTKIGDSNIIGAHAFVRNLTTPPNVAIGGVPAKVLKESIDWDARDIDPLSLVK